MTTALRVAVRVHSEPETWKPPQTARPWDLPAEEYIVVADSETRLTPALPLLFGAYAVVKVSWGTPEPVASWLEEGLAYPESLPASAPAEYELLRAYARSRRPAVDPAALLPGAVDVARPDLRLLTRSGFVRNILLPACEAREPVVQFNWGFDAARWAEYTGDARGRFLGGFRLVLLGGRTKKGKRFARVWARTKRLAPKRHMLELGAITPHRDIRKPVFARPLDLHTLVFALTGRDHSLRSAASKDGFDLRVQKMAKPVLGVITPELIDYCRRDVAVTVALYVAAMREFRRHPIGLDPMNAMSPATLASSYLDAIGAERPLRRIE